MMNLERVGDSYQITQKKGNTNWVMQLEADQFQELSQLIDEQNELDGWSKKSLNKTFESTELKPDLDFESVVYDLYELFLRKNSDYDGAFDHSLDTFGLESALIRLGDKYYRAYQLWKSGRQLVADESFKDTITDLANYSIMTLRWMELTNEGVGDDDQPVGR